LGLPAKFTQELRKSGKSSANRKKQIANGFQELSVISAAFSGKTNKSRTEKKIV
jgi:hypothetical protein